MDPSDKLQQAQDDLRSSERALDIYAQNIKEQGCILLIYHQELARVEARVDAFHEAPLWRRLWIALNPSKRWPAQETTTNE